MSNKNQFTLFVLNSGYFFSNVKTEERSETSYNNGDPIKKKKKDQLFGPDAPFGVNCVKSESTTVCSGYLTMTMIGCHHHHLCVQFYKPLTIIFYSPCFLCILGSRPLTLLPCLHTPVNLIYLRLLIPCSSSSHLSDTCWLGLLTPLHSSPLPCQLALFTSPSPSNLTLALPHWLLLTFYLQSPHDTPPISHLGLSLFYPHPSVLLLTLLNIYYNDASFTLSKLNCTPLYCDTSILKSDQINFD